MKSHLAALAAALLLAAPAAALAQAGSVAVLLPVAFYCLADERKPPIQAFRSAGAHMAAYGSFSLFDPREEAFPVTASTDRPERS